MRRSALAAVLVVVGGLALSGCTAVDQNALTRMDGVPALVNCGTYIGEVEVRDADSGRLVWTARVTAEPTADEHFRTSAAQIGRLPNEGWSQIGEYVPDPTPVNWDFLVNGGPEHLVVADADLVEGKYLVGGHEHSYEWFRNEVCEDDGGPLMDVARAVLLGVLAIIAVITWMLLWAKWKNGKRSVGWHQRDGVWRWWNGTNWQ